LADDNAGAGAFTLPPGLEIKREESPRLDVVADATTASDGVDSAAEDSSAWRQEIATRLNRYQARRKPRPPRYPSLRLHFEQEPPVSTRTVSDDYVASPPALSTFTQQALALDGFSSRALDSAELLKSAPPEAPASAATAPPWRFDDSAVVSTDASMVPHSAASITAHPTAKIIEFPRSWTPPVAPLDELAEPIMDRPRILEAPEVVPPPPALGGITIEPVPLPAWEKRPGIDIPLQAASLSRRICSAAIDYAIVASACSLFGFIFWKIAASRPPQIQMIGLAAGLCGVFWAAYQYLLVVYAGTTPGLLLAGLELARFDGNTAGRRLRRWRVLASFLSAFSLGMGYAWVFLDEDALCWHDRITHTYLAPKLTAKRTQAQAD
jgi:uncharacterized RDD family membrane protein YckC